MFLLGYSPAKNYQFTVFYYNYISLSLYYLLHLSIRSSRINVRTAQNSKLFLTDFVNIKIYWQKKKKMRVQKDVVKNQRTNAIIFSQSLCKNRAQERR